MRGGFITSDFFAIVGVPPALGRPFVAGDDRKVAPVAILDYEVWRRRFGGDHAIVGRSPSLNNAGRGRRRDAGGLPVPYDDIEVWLPIEQFTGGLSRDQRSIVAIGRLMAGTSLADAQSELSGIAAQLEQEHPRTNAGRGVLVEPFHAWLTTGIDQPLVLVFALVLVLLAVAAANVTSLQLGATLGRRARWPSARRLARAAGESPRSS